MAMQQIGAVLGGPAPKKGSQARDAARTRNPVRRGSRLVGTCEAEVWRRTDREEVRRVVLAAERYDREGRAKGQRNGPLGHVALELIRLLANVVNYKTGRLDPSYVYLMRKLNRSKDAVSQALAALREHGFLDWMRRHERIEEAEGPGPRVRQVTNAYRMSLPARAARILGRLFSSPPLPDDMVHEREERAASLAAYKADLPLSELPFVEVEDDRLAQLLSELGRAVQERESARQGETRTKGL